MGPRRLVLQAEYSGLRGEWVSDTLLAKSRDVEDVLLEEPETHTALRGPELQVNISKERLQERCFDSYGLRVCTRPFKGSWNMWNWTTSDESLESFSETLIMVPLSAIHGRTPGNTSGVISVDGLWEDRMGMAVLYGWLLSHN